MFKNKPIYECILSAKDWTYLTSEISFWQGNLELIHFLALQYNYLKTIGELSKKQEASAHIFLKTIQGIDFNTQFGYGISNIDPNLESESESESEIDYGISSIDPNLESESESESGVEEEPKSKQDNRKETKISEEFLKEKDSGKDSGISSIDPDLVSELESEIEEESKSKQHDKEAEINEEEEETSSKEKDLSSINEQSLPIDNKQAPLIETDKFILSGSKKVEVTKFGITGQQFTLNFKLKKPFRDISQEVVVIFQKIIDKIFLHIRENARIGLEFSHPSLFRNFIIPFRPRKEITGDRVCAFLDYLMQSEESLYFDKTLHINFTSISPLSIGGSYRRKKIWNHVQWMKHHLKPGGCFITIENKNDMLCFPRAIVTAIAYYEQKFNPSPENVRHYNNVRRGDRQSGTYQKKLAIELVEKVGLSIEDAPFDETHFQAFQDYLYQHGNYRLIIFASNCMNQIIYRGKNDSDKFLYLYLITEPSGTAKTGHYIVCTQPHILFGKKNWCSKCFKPYDKVSNHRCATKGNKCYCCYRVPKCPYIKWVNCHDCLRVFVSTDCYKNHLQSKQRLGTKRKIDNNNDDDISLLPRSNSICNLIRKCSKCKVLISYKNKRYTKDKKPFFHKCYHYFCFNCLEPHPFGKLDSCYIQTISNKKENKQTEENLHKRLFYDFEAITIDSAGWNKAGELFFHTPFMVSAIRTCKYCSESVFKNSNLDGECEYCGKNYLEFFGERACDDFCEYIFTDANKGLVCIGHYASGYDLNFILNFLYRNQKKPAIIMKGRKIILLSIHGIRFIDSWNFLAMPLSNLADAFNLDQITGDKHNNKKFFPYKLLNNPNCFEYSGKTPDSWFFDPGNMRVEEREKFYNWYRENKNQSFNFLETVRSYCKSDCLILMRACYVFEKSIHEITQGVFPFDSAISLASLSMYIYRRNFLENDKKIALIPPQGYFSLLSHSKMALIWLKYIAWKEGVHIQHARNGGEKYIPEIKTYVDGYSFNQTTNKPTIYDFCGCTVHGCPCIKNRRALILNHPNKTVEMAYTETIRKQNKLREANYDVRVLWSCEYKEKMRSDGEFRLFTKVLHIKMPLKPRDSLVGGRVENFRLHHKIYKPDVWIKAADINSLYPSKMKWERFPLGHPTVHTEPPFPDLNNFFGLIYTTLLPPTNLKIPLIPSKVNDRLSFHLCTECASNRDHFADCCQHNANERAITVVLTSPEFQKSLSLGYIPLYIYEVWEYKQTLKYEKGVPGSGLFDKFINLFLKLKLENSGWPSTCGSSIEGRKGYINEIYEKEGILLDVEKIQKNNNLRTIGKIGMNSLYGKMCQNEQQIEHRVISDPEEFADIVFNNIYTTHSLTLLTDQLVLLSFSKKDEHIKPSPHANSILSSFITAYSRLELYKQLEILQDNVLYVDTDSVYYVQEPNGYNIPLGCSMGEFSSELDKYGGDEIVGISEFTSSGPKEYSVKVVRKQDNKVIAYETKAKSFRISYSASKHLCHSSMVQNVFSFLENYGKVDPISVYQTQFQKTPQGDVISADIQKKFNISLATKRKILFPTPFTVPWGYKAV